MLRKSKCEIFAKKFVPVKELCTNLHKKAQNISPKFHQNEAIHRKEICTC